MAYLEEIRNQLLGRNYQKVLILWQEYCLGESLDSEELTQILEAIKQSDFAKQFANHVIDILPQVLTLTSSQQQLAPLKAIYDLETQDSVELQEIAISFLQNVYGSTPLFNEKLKLVNLRGGGSFQGCISNFCLLNHLQKGNFVFHTAGWGVGEITEVSFVREQVVIEFEQLNGAKKEISFKNGFKTLIPLEHSHFLARRFGNPDALEQEARENPASVIHCLLASLGPKTAAEIKEEMTDYVIPEKDYSKWWQQARAKLKKDPLLDVPENVKEPFRLRKGEASWKERIEKAFLGKNTFYALLAAANTLVRDCPEIAKNAEAKNSVIEKLRGSVHPQKPKAAEEIQLLLFMEHALGIPTDAATKAPMIQDLESIEEVLSHIEMLSLKKRFLDEIHELRGDWRELFLQILISSESNQVKDYALELLSTKENEPLVQKLLFELLAHPKKHPESVVWYCTKLIENKAPFLNTKTYLHQFIEAFLIALHAAEQKSDFKELTKKMTLQLTKNRFALVRELFKDASLAFVKEFLLLVSKCHSFSSHELKIFQSLAEVAYPSLAKEEKEQDADMHIVWTTEAGYRKTKERIAYIATIEMVDVAKEIEAARALGDLRENSEFKFAQERRARLQSELKLLSDLFQKARIITKDDIDTESVSIGSIVTLTSSDGESICYTLLGPWDADADKNILSLQSKAAQEMLGKKLHDTVSLKGELFKINAISSYLEGEQSR